MCHSLTRPGWRASPTALFATGETATRNSASDWTRQSRLAWKSGCAMIQDAADNGDWRAAEAWLRLVSCRWSYGRNRMELTGAGRLTAGRGYRALSAAKQDGNGGQLPAVTVPALTEGRREWKRRLKSNRSRGRRPPSCNRKADIAVFGGAAGGGKVFRLLLGTVPTTSATENSGACIFRRTVPMIRQPGGLWDASRDIYARLGAEAREASRSNGAFHPGPLSNSRAWNWKPTATHGRAARFALLAFDELTQFTERQFFYLLSRNRSTCGVRPYVRATCNPDSDSWLRNFLAWWIDDASGLPIPERAGVLRWFVRREDALTWGDTRQELVEKFGERCRAEKRHVHSRQA